MVLQYVEKCSSRSEWSSAARSISPGGKRLITVLYTGNAIAKRWFIMGVFSPVNRARLSDELWRIDNERTN
jgi:hypothetical protein